ncbi:MAG: hypothetical protein KGL95_06790, partial [Patescibacteria group bacterium]|nr:hypothetical protein [Patescibacteria group bacterium]
MKPQLPNQEPLEKAIDPSKKGLLFVHYALNLFTHPAVLLLSFFGATVLSASLTLNGTNPLQQMNFKPTPTQAVLGGRVIPVVPLKLSGTVVFNIPARFYHPVTAESLAIDTNLNVQGDANVNGDYYLKGKKLDFTTFVTVVTAGTGISVTGGASPVITNTDLGSAQKIFGTVVAGTTSITADNNKDVLTIAPGSGIAVAAAGKTITISSTNAVVWQDTGSVISPTDTTGKVQFYSPNSYIDSNGNAVFAGTIQVGSTTTFAGVTYTWPTTSSQGSILLQTNSSGTLAWVNPTTLPGATQFVQVNGTIYPQNSTVDFLIGGVSTVSAKFGFINVASGVPTATIAGNITLNSAGVIETTSNQPLTVGGATTGDIILKPLGGSGTVALYGDLNQTGDTTTSGTLTFSTLGSNIQTTNSQTLTLGGNTTGNILLNPFNGTGIVTINGGITVLGTVQLSSLSTGILHAGSNGVITSSAVNLASADITGTLPVTNGGTGLSTVATGSILYGNGTSQLQELPIGTVTGAVLVSNGANAPNYTTNLTALTSLTSSGVIRFSAFSTGILHTDTTGTLSTSAVNLASADVTGILPLANGGTNANLTVNPGGVVFSNLTGFQISSVGSTGQCLVSGAAGAPTWSQCAFGVNYFTQNNGALFPSNPTTDFLIGGNSTASAKFAFVNVNLGTPTASISAGLSGAAYLTATGFLQTTANQNLTLGGGATGNIYLTPLALATVNGGLTVTGTTMLSSLSTGILHAGTNGILSSSAVNLGSTDVTGVLPLINGGTGVALTANQGGVVYSGSSGFAISDVGTGGQCLVSNGLGAPSWVTCAAGSAINWFNQSSGAIYAINNTVDFLIGGNSTASAKFGLINVAGGTPTATISGTFGSAYLTADGNLQTTNNQSLTIGGATTGNIYLSPFGGIGIATISGNFGVSGTSTFSSLSTGVAHLSATGLLSSSAVNLASADVAGVLPLANGGTNANLTVNAGGIIYSGNSTLAISTPGGAGQCLVSGGTGAPSWVTCAGGTNWFNSTNGVVYPIYGTLDLLVGGNSTASAKFAFINTSSGTPTASISAGVAGATYLTADGNLQTTAMQSLVLGGSTTGNITVNPQGGTGTFGINASNVSINGAPGLTQSSPSCVTTLNGIVTGWGTCALGTQQWDILNGVLFANNTTVDFALGGNSTASARFAVINDDALSGKPTTASLSAGLTGATYISADGNIQTTAQQTLTLGSNTTGNIVLNPLQNVSVNGGFIVSGTTQLSSLSTGIVHSSTNGTLSSSAVNLASTDVTGVLTVVNGGTGLSTITSGALLYGNGTSNLNSLIPTAAGNVLVSNGTNPT